VIQWDKAANITGGIYLVNSANGSVVGWILPQTGPNQTSYPWNTRDLLVSRTSPTKITVPVGTYIIKVMFDSPQDPSITSAPFSIIPESQAQTLSASAAISNGAFVPASLTVRKNTKIVFTNKDQISYQILVSSFSPFSITAGGSYILDTTSLSPGPYALYSTAYPALRMNITVQ
jgi:plastocyanin